jgi:hypothetical protein
MDDDDDDDLTAWPENPNENVKTLLSPHPCSQYSIQLPFSPTISQTLSHYNDETYAMTPNAIFSVFDRCYG